MKKYECTCGHVVKAAFAEWDTFMTTGACPACGKPGEIAAATASSPASPANDGVVTAFGTTVCYDRKRCRGALYFTEDELYFLCSSSESIYKREVAQRFGLIGALLYGFSSGFEAAGSVERLEVSLSERVQDHPHSFVLGAQQLTRFKRGFFSGTFFKAGGARYVIEVPPEKTHWPHISVWCRRHEIPVEGFG